MSCRLRIPLSAWPTLTSLLFGAVLSTYAQSDLLPLRESVVEEVINQVSILTGENLEEVPAVTNMVFKAPDFLQTGRRSRARLKAEDGTITRIGSNSLFSFDEASRTINLKRGSILFHSPEGRGGGRVVTASATASVLGTTIIVAATQDGGFKLLVLEGRAQVAFPDGTIRQLTAGQMTFVRPDSTPFTTTNASNSGTNDPSDTGATSATDTPAGEPGPVLEFDLDRMTQGSRLLSSFSEDLPSIERIATATQEQIDRISGGELEVTDALIIGVNDDEDLVVAIDKDITETAREVQDEDDTNESEDEDDSSTTPPTERTPEELFSQAIESEVDLSTGFPEDNLFDLPGFTLDSDDFSTIEEAFQFYGFIAGTVTIPEGRLDLSDIALTQEGADFSEINLGGCRTS